MLFSCSKSSNNYEYILNFVEIEINSYWYVCIIMNKRLYSHKAYWFVHNVKKKYYE